MMTALTPSEQRYFTRKRIYKIIKRERAFLRLLHNTERSHSRENL